MTVNYTQEQFQEYKAKYERLRYVKTDNNGTEYYDGVCDCPRCNGDGIVYSHVLNGVPVPCQPDRGICYLCGGEKVVPATIKVFTPEHAAKLEKQRTAKAAKRQEEVAKKMEETRQATYNTNLKIGYQEINITIDEWVGMPTEKYKYYRIAHKTEKAYLLNFLDDLYKSDTQAVSRWIPIKAVHFKEA